MIAKHAIRAVTALTLSAAFASPLIAQQEKVLTTVEGWGIVRDSATQGCAVQKVNEDGYLVRVGKTEAGNEFGYFSIYTDDDSVYVLEGETKDVTFDLDGERFFGTADGAAIKNFRGGFATANNPAFGDALARKYVLTINPDGKKPLVVDLKGTFKAMDAVRACDADSVAGMDIKDDSKRADLDAAALSAWTQLMHENSRAARVAQDATAVLVFPEITKVGLGIGAEGGNGVLVKKGGETMGYYRTNSVSVGAQIGAQKYGYAVMFLSDAALDKFLARRGYELGVDGSIAILERGLTAEVDTTNIKVDTVGVVFDEKGLMASATVEGSRIKPLD